MARTLRIRLPARAAGFIPNVQETLMATVEALEPELSLVMPAYNEADVIGDAVSRADRAVARTRMAYEIIVVDDGSSDGTREVVESRTQGNGNVRVVGYDRNLGKGHALKTGFAHAKGDVVVFVDSDLDVDPGQIVRYVRALEHGDIAVASKWHPQSSVEVPFVRSVLSHGFNVLVKLLTGMRLGDTQAGLKALKRRSCENLFSRLSVKRFAFDVELLVAANFYGLKVVELPVKIQMRGGLFSLREVWWMFLDLLGITYRLRVLKWYRRGIQKSRTI